MAAVGLDFFYFSILSTFPTMLGDAVDSLDWGLSRQQPAPNPHSTTIDTIKSFLVSFHVPLQNGCVSDFHSRSGSISNVHFSCTVFSFFVFFWF